MALQQFFCDSHEIGNVLDTDGIEWMLEDCRKAPLSIFLTLPSTIPATNDELETAGGNLTAKKQLTFMTNGQKY